MKITPELRQAIKDHREPAILASGKLIPGSIPYLRNLLIGIEDIFERDDLLSAIAGEYSRADLHEEHLLVQRERLRNHPEAAIMWLGVADTLSYRADGALEAKQFAAKGVEISRNVGTLIRYALSCQAWVARRTNDVVLFETSIAELVQDAPNIRQDDCALFESLVSDLPPGFCSPHLLEDYKQALGCYGT